MVLDDYNIFIFRYALNSEFYYLFRRTIIDDFNLIKLYYLNIFSWNKWKYDIILLIILPFFYLFLIFIKLFHIWIIFKLIFYILKYILRYIFILIDFSFYLLILKLNIKNKIILILIKFIYSLCIKNIYRLYALIFNVLPSLIHYLLLIELFYTIQNNLIYFIHRILDFLEWLPSSPISTFIIFVYKGIKNLIFLLLHLYNIRHDIYPTLKDISRDLTWFSKINVYFNLLFYKIYLKYLIYVLFYLNSCVYNVISLLGFTNILKCIYRDFLLDYSIFYYSLYWKLSNSFKDSDYFFLFCPFIKFFL